MTIRDDFQPGEFCWIDLSAHDMPKAIEFYGQLFGWQAMQQETQGGPPYAFFVDGQNGCAAVGQMSDEMKAQGIPPMWNSYVCVADCAASEAKAKELGATITVPTMEVPGHGKLCFMLDPDGGSIALWQTTSKSGPGLKIHEPGSLAWNELMCRDVDKAKQFYGALFGWEFVDMPMTSPAGEMTYTMARSGDTDVAGMMPMVGPQFEGVPTHWMVYFAVDNCADMTQKAEGLGGKVLVPPMTIQVGTFSCVSDVQGGTFSMIQRSNADC